MKVGDTETNKVSFTPADTADQTITWTSNHPEVATVENEIIRAVGAGTAVITATTTNGKTASCNVTVTQLTEGDCGAAGSNLRWKMEDRDRDGVLETLVISGTGEMKDYSGYRYYSSKEFAPWRGYNNQIKTLVLNEGITVIGSGAFSEIPQLTELKLPKTLQKIGYEAFRKNTGLKKLVIPGNVKWIYSGAFGACNNLEYLEVQNGVEEIMADSFAGSPLKKIILPETLKTTGGEYGDGGRGAYEILQNQNGRADWGKL